MVKILNMLKMHDKVKSKFKSSSSQVQGSSDFVHGVVVLFVQMV